MTPHSRITYSCFDFHLFVFCVNSFSSRIGFLNFGSFPPAWGFIFNLPLVSIVVILNKRCNRFYFTLIKHFDHSYFSYYLFSSNFTFEFSHSNFRSQTVCFDKHLLIGVSYFPSQKNFALLVTTYSTVPINSKSVQWWSEWNWLRRTINQYGANKLPKPK